MTFCVSLFCVSLLGIGFAANAAGYKVEVKHVQGDDLMKVTEIGNPAFSFEYKGSDSERFHETKMEFIGVDGLSRPLLWTEWSSGQIGVVKVFDLNCPKPQHLRLDRKTYGVPSRTLDSEGLRVTILNYDPFTAKVSTPRTVEWLIPLTCNEKPRLGSPTTDYKPAESK